MASNRIIMSGIIVLTRTIFPVSLSMNLILTHYGIILVLIMDGEYGLIPLIIMYSFLIMAIFRKYLMLNFLFPIIAVF